jgi:hypothetical protein
VPFAHIDLHACTVATSLTGAPDIWNIIWPYAIGGCYLNRDISGILKDAGEWDNAETIESDEQPSAMLPRVWGVLVKPL